MNSDKTYHPITEIGILRDALLEIVNIEEDDDQDPETLLCRANEIARKALGLDEDGLLKESVGEPVKG